MIRPSGYFDRFDLAGKGYIQSTYFLNLGSVLSNIFCESVCLSVELMVGGMADFSGKMSLITSYAHLIWMLVDVDEENEAEMKKSRVLALKSLEHIEVREITSRQTAFTSYFVSLDLICSLSAPSALKNIIISISNKQKFSWPSFQAVRRLYSNITQSGDMPSFHLRPK